MANNSGSPNFLNFNFEAEMLRQHVKIVEDFSAKQDKQFTKALMKQHRDFKNKALQEQTKRRGDIEKKLTSLHVQMENLKKEMEGCQQELTDCELAITAIKANYKEQENRITKGQCSKIKILDILKTGTYPQFTPPHDICRRVVDAVDQQTYQGEGSPQSGLEIILNTIGSIPALDDATIPGPFNEINYSNLPLPDIANSANLRNITSAHQPLLDHTSSSTNDGHDAGTGEYVSGSP